jgi:hypothetical protein
LRTIGRLGRLNLPHFYVAGPAGYIYGDNTEGNWNSDIRVEKNKNIFGKLAMLEDGIVIGGVLQESI